MNKNIKEMIDTRLSNVTVDDRLRHKLLSIPSRPRLKTRRFLIGMTAACLCMLLSIPVLAVAFPSFNRLIAQVRPEIVQFLQPIELISEDNGIRMEVVAATNDEDTAVVYLTMQDLTGDRIDKSIDLYHYSIQGTNGLTHNIVAYDEKTKTATIRMLGSGGNKLNGKKVTVAVQSFLSKKQRFDKFDTGITSEEMLQASKTIQLDMNHIPGGSGDLFDSLRSKGIIDILKPNQLNISLNKMDFVYISNVGMIDGKLHVQIRWHQKENGKNHIDDHGFLYLIDSLGKEVSATTVYFGLDDSGQTTYGNGYQEYIFDVAAEQLSDYKLFGDGFVTSEYYLEGDWQTTFKIEAVKGGKQVSCNLDVGGVHIDSVSISPLGITLQGQTVEPMKDGDDKQIDLDITIPSLSDFSQNYSLQSNYNGEYVRIKCIPFKPLDVEKIDTIEINGIPVEFKS